MRSLRGQLRPREGAGPLPALLLKPGVATWPTTCHQAGTPRSFFCGGKGVPMMSFVNRSWYKTLPYGLQDLRRGKRYSASRIGKSLEENDISISFTIY
jgi:hypothetical protein